MKVLIISYYWPPAGGSGVQRWLKFAKYLPDFGIEPVLYVPDNPNYPVVDEGLLKESASIKVIKKPIFNLQDFVSGDKKETNVANVSKKGILSWVRGNLFIPDPKIFWIKPSVKFLSKYIVDHQIDVVISTGPPHSMHLIAEKLKSKLNIKWIADFRDPWTTLYYTNDFKLSEYAKRKNEKLETKVLQNADVVLTVSNHLQKELSKTANNVSVITNGFDDEVLLDKPVKLDAKFSISHIGLLPRQSNPKLLWKVLGKLIKTDDAFKKALEISLTGNVNQEIVESIKQNDLEDNLSLNGYVSHQKSILLQKASQVLLLLIPNTSNSKGILTGKLFEYITAKRPILAIGPKDGDLADVLNETKTGTLVDFNDELKLKETIISLYEKYKNGDLLVDSENYNQYHRKELTKSLSEIITQVVQDNKTR